tara:strand:- start:111 stop:557 length:447 start_codon:yes stop_codon:yes gene_type:complete
MSNSIVDYVFRALGLEYLNRTDIVQNPPKEEGGPIQESPSAPIQESPSTSVEEQVTESIGKVEEVGPTNSIQTNEPSGEAQEVQFVTKVQKTETLDTAEATSNSVTTVQEVLSDMMGDAPACNECGHITIRNGSCYKCLNCGNSLGCS